MSVWRQMRLKDLGRWSSGGTPPRNREDLWRGGLPWLSAKDIDSTRLRATTTFVSEEAASRYSRIVPAGALLMIVRGMALAHGLSVVRVDKRSAFNQDLRGLVCGPSIDSRFVHYALTGNRRRLGRHIDQAAHGTARVTDSIYAESLPMTGLETQVQVVDFLDGEHARVDQLLEELASFAAGAERPPLDHFRRETSSARRGAIGYRYEVQLGKMLDGGRVEDGAIPAPYVRNANVHWDDIRVDDLKVMPFTAADRRKFMLSPGDLLVCEGGEPGRAAIWDGQVEDCYFQKALHRVRPIGSDSTRFLLWALRDAADRGVFTSDGPGRYVHLPAEQLRATRVPLPSAEAQHTIATATDRAACRLRAIQTETSGLVSALAEYRDALTTETVTGRLDVRTLGDTLMEESLAAVREGERPEVFST